MALLAQGKLCRESDYSKNGTTIEVKDAPSSPPAIDSDNESSTKNVKDAESENEEDQECSEDDSLADFIVSDSASETELRRGSPRKLPLPAPRRPRRKLLIESDSSESEDEGVRLKRTVDRRSGSGTDPRRTSSITHRSSSEAEELEKELHDFHISPSSINSIHITHGSLNDEDCLIQKLKNNTSPSSHNISADPHGLGFFDHTTTSPLSVALPSGNSIAEESRLSTGSRSTAPQYSNPGELSDTSIYDQNVTVAPKAHVSKNRTPKPKSAAAQERERQRWFKAHRQEMAEKWLQELDQTATEGKLSKMTASTGGIPIHWSKKMITTAGHAAINAATRTASISLSDKIVIDEDRLHNVLAHEFCHVADLLLTRSAKTGHRHAAYHGPAFYAWGRHVAAAFPARGIDVLRYHSYPVTRKYAWACARCGRQYQRHTATIDPQRHRCAKPCLGTLQQIRPLPAQRTEHQQFVKDVYARMKALGLLDQGAGFRDAMGLVNRKWGWVKELRAGRVHPVEGVLDTWLVEMYVLPARARATQPRNRAEDADVADVHGETHGTGLPRPGGAGLPVEVGLSDDEDNEDDVFYDLEDDDGARDLAKTVARARTEALAEDFAGIALSS